MDKTTEPRSVAPAGRSCGRWQRQLREAVRDWGELAALLELSEETLGGRTPGVGEFPLLVPRGFVARMRKRDLHDPLLLQVLPRDIERAVVPGFTADPLDETARARSGVLQKYAQRALLIVSGSCPVHCRYCFRRAFPYSAQLAARDDFQPALAVLRRTTDVSEVILSGGDPLSVSNRRLAALFDALATITSLRKVRVHTRFPIMIPERIDDGLCRVLHDSRLATVVVVHANHANELDDNVAAALHRLRGAADFTLNQSVLLHGVNDDAATLAALSEALFDCGVLPYYLHMLDPVAGAAHFEVDEARARGLIATLRQRLPGYLVPRLVREVPGESGKTAVA